MAHIFFERLGHEKGRDLALPQKYTTRVNGTGNWNVTATTPLSDGQASVVATQTDLAGNTSSSATVNFTVDTVAPASPLLTSPASGAFVSTNTPQITGTGEIGATIELIIGGN